jgi:hypothetical protein
MSEDMAKRMFNAQLELEGFRAICHFCTARRNGGSWCPYFIRDDLCQLTSIKSSSSFQTSSIHLACETIFNKQKETISQLDKAEEGIPLEGAFGNITFKALL